MSVAALELPPPRGRVVDRTVDLVAVYDEDVDVVVLPRPSRAMDPSLDDYVEQALLGTDVPRLARVHAARPDFGALLPASASSGRRALADDLALLVDLTAELVGADEVGVRLRALARPMCPRFHVDHVSVRVVCTYLGAGTQWLDREDDERSVRSMPAGAIGLLKGTAWPRRVPRGAVHRSPPMSPGDVRLLVTLDPL
jgi:hypothetical protein